MNLGQVYATRVNYVNYLLYRQKDYEAVGVVATRELESYPYGGDLWLALAQAKYELGDGEEALAAALKADRFMGIPLSGAVLKQIRHGEELKIEEFIAE
jgi:hypothetical protein